MGRAHKVVGVHPARALAARPRLFAALEAAFGTRFVAWAPGGQAVDALLRFDETVRPGEPQPGNGLALPTFACCGDPRAAGDAERVELARSEAVDRRVRGIVLTDRLVGAGLRPTVGEEVLAVAVADSGPAWVCSAGPVPAHRVRSVLPELAPDQVLYALLSQRAIATVALKQFLDELTHDGGWEPPALRAAFVFDDPNLHWRTYGFIDYRRLVRHADEHGYHVAMALIPMDARLPHPETVALFRRRSDRLSLTIHGNDHVRDELLAVEDPSLALATAAHAVRRVARLEDRTGLRVDRVMMPPHGLCSAPMARSLAAVGFDALCAIHPRPWTAEAPTDPLLAGWRPAGFVAGCPVVPRIPLCSTAADIALRAFLDQPIVLYGHHEDVADGLEPLAEAAARVNALGGVRWTSVGDIVTSHSALRRTGSVLAVRPYARRVILDRPDGAASAITVERPPDALEPGALTGWSLGPGAPRPFGTQAPMPARGRVEVRLHGAGDVDPRTVPAPRWRPWPPLRRAATELRDRALPLRPARNA